MTTDSTVHVVDTTPSPHFFNSFRQRKLGWKVALAELIDNSFDAGATRVEVDFNRDSSIVTVADNGAGVPLERMGALVRYGDHDATLTTQLGRYGVGAKEACLWAAEAVFFNSAFNGEAFHMVVDWARLAEAGSYGVQVRSEKPRDGQTAGDLAAALGETGLCIRLKGAKDLRDGADTTDLVQFLSRTYAPALADGRSLRVSKRFRKDLRVHEVRPYAAPPCIEVLRETITLSDGRSAALEVGIVESVDANTAPGIGLVYRFRELDRRGFGCADYPIRNINGTVSLIGNWNLLAHKDGISQGLDELEEVMFEAMEPLLERARALSHDESRSALEKELSADLTMSFGEAFGFGRAIRQRGGGNQGTVEPTGTGATHRRASAVRPDPRGRVRGGAGGRDVTALTVVFDVLPEGELSRVENQGGLALVRLNERCPAVADAMKTHQSAVLRAFARAALASDIAKKGTDLGHLFNNDAEATFSRVMYALYERSIGEVPHMSPESA